MKKKNKPRDEIMLNHLLKTFNCGFHKDKKKLDKEKKKDWKNYNSL